MKKKTWLVLSLAFFGLGNDSRAQSYELNRLILDIEKLSQLKNILGDLYKGYEILKTGYSTIKGVSEGNYNLHKAFLDGLLAVSPAIQKYEKIGDIVDLQIKIFTTYKTALNRYRKNNLVSAGELAYIGEVYSNLVDRSAKNLDKLLQVLTSGKLRMNDAERLREIDGIFLETQDQDVFLQQFNDRTDLLIMERKVQDDEVQTERGFYGIK